MFKKIFHPFKIIKRSINNNIEGIVELKLPIKSQIEAMQLLDIGKFDRVRGLAWSVNIPPEISNKVIRAVKDQLCRFTTNIYVATDYSRDSTTRDCAFGITLYTETKSRRNISAEEHYIGYDSKDDSSTFDAEKFGKRVARRLALDISKKAYTDDFNQSTLLLLMALSESHVSSMRFSNLTNDS